MKTTNTLKELSYSIAISHIIDMQRQLIKDKDYFEQLHSLVALLVKPEFLADLHFNEYWQISYHCLHSVLWNAEQREEFEMCSVIQDLIVHEEELYKEWCLTLPDEETQQDALDELDYIRIAIKSDRDTI